MGPAARWLDTSRLYLRQAVGSILFISLILNITTHTHTRKKYPRKFFRPFRENENMSIDKSTQ